MSISINEMVAKAGPAIPPGTCDIPEEQAKYDALYLGLNPEVALSPATCHELEAIQKFSLSLWPRRAMSPVLVAGAGPGIGVRALLGMGFDAFGCDISQVVMQYWADMQTRFACCPLHKMPYPDKWFGLTVCCDVLEHVPERLIDQSLAEIARVTKHAAFVAVSRTPSNAIADQHMTLWDWPKWDAAFAKIGFNRGASDPAADRRLYSIEIK